MEEAEQSVYLAQLKAEFDSCDTASSGFLGPQEVTALCRKLHLDAQLPLMLDSLLGGGGGGGACARVDFEAFKDNFVDFLSRSLDLTSDDDSSYLQPVVIDEVKPKFVKGEKRYGRRSRPDVTPSHDSPSLPPAGDGARSSPAGLRGPKVRRAASLDSVESPDEEAAASPKHATWPHFQPTASEQEEESACHRPIAPELGAQAHDKLEQVALVHFRKLLCGSAPICCSTPHRAPEDGSRPQDFSPSPLTATPGAKVLSRLDDGSGCASPESVLALWSDEGVRDARHILQTLDFPADERVRLCELTLALDNELLGSGNGIHRVALVSYKNEIQHLRAASEQACGQRDKAKADLERVERRNLRLLREADERLAAMELLHRTRGRELERDFRERLAAQRGQAEQDSDAAAQQLQRESRELRRQLSALGAREAELREELGAAAQEKAHLEEELADAKRRLSEAENGAQRLRADLKQLLHLKFGSLDPEDKVSRLLEDCERQCRELRDKNDELTSELLRSRKRSRGKSAECAEAEAPSTGESDSDDADMKRGSSSPGGRPQDATAAVSIQTEFALEKLKSKHKQELLQLNVQMETQVNYYERSLDRMRQSMEVERKDIAQAFKLEISELEEQKAEAQRQAKILNDKLANQLQHGGRSWEQERRMQRERADSEQNFAREIGNLVQRLSAEKDQLEAELKLKMDQEVTMLREEAALELSQVKLHHARGRRRLLRQVHGRQRWDRRLRRQTCREEEHLQEDKRRRREARGCRFLPDEASDRSFEEEEPVRLQKRLHPDVEEEVARLRLEKRAYMATADQLCAQIVEMEEEQSQLGHKMKKQLVDMEKLVLLLQERDQRAPARSRLEEAQSDNAALQERLCVLQQEVDKLDEEVANKRTKLEEMEQHRESSRQEVERLKQETAAYRQEVVSLSGRNAQLSAANAELSARLRERGEAREDEELRQEQRRSLEEELSGCKCKLREMEAELSTAAAERRTMEAELRREAQLGHERAQEAESNNRKLMKGNEEKDEHNRRLLEQVQQLLQDQQKLSTQVARTHVAWTQAEGQADAALGLVQREGAGLRERAEQLLARLQDEQRRSRRLEEELQLCARQSSAHIGLKEEQHEKALTAARHESRELQVKLEASRAVLHEKVRQLQQQMAKNVKSSVMLKELYAENSHLLKTLQLTERRHQNAHKDKTLLEEKVAALNRLLGNVAALHT